MAIHIGMSGCSYDHWNGVLYPPRTPVRDRLAVHVDVRTVNWMPASTDGCAPARPPGVDVSEDLQVLWR